MDESVSRLQVSRNLSSRLENVSPPLVSRILSSIQSQHAALKINLCIHCLTQSAHTSENGQDGAIPHARGNTRKPRPRARKAIEADDSAATNVITQSQQNIPQASISTLTLDELTRILLVEPPTAAESRLRHLIYKFHLLAAFSDLQQSKPVVDSDWRQFCDSSENNRTQLIVLLEKVFVYSEISSPSAEKDIHDAALNLLSIW